MTSKGKMAPLYQKPDAADKPIICTSPITSDTPVKYEKPHAYDEKPPVVITASRQGSRSSRLTVDSYSSRYFQKNNSSVIRQSSIGSSTSRSSTMVGSPPLSPTPTKTYTPQVDITSFILSQSTPTIQTTFAGHTDEIPFDSMRPSSPANSVIGQEISKNHANDIVAAVATLLSNDRGIVSSFFLQDRAQKPKHKKKHNNIIVYNFKKASVFKPNQHHIYLHIDHPEEEDEEDVLAYRKIQPGSSWGLQSMLYCNRNDGQGIKVAEARRRAFQKNITIESADYDNSSVNDITQTYIPNNKLRAVATNNVFCHDLVKRSQSNILFEYETWFHGSCIRWTRPSLLSHDFTCEIKLTKPEKKLQQFKKKTAPVKDEGFIDSDSDDDEDDHDNHSHRTCRRWKLAAEFDSHNINYLNQNLGTLSIDLDILNQVEKERCDLLEANIVMTCSTLIDLIREIMALFASFAAAPPYLPLYFCNVLNFSSEQIGFVLAIAPFIQSVACPIWSFIVDKKPKLHGPIMAITAFLGSSAIMAIMVIGHSVSSKEEIPTTLNVMSYQLSNAALVGITSCLSLTFAFFALPNVSLLDSAVMKILGPNKLLYGEQRLWGSVSSGLTILIVGQLLSFTKSYDVIFYVFGVSVCLFIFISSFADVNQEETQYIFVPNEPPSLEQGTKIVPLTPNQSEKLLDHCVPINNYSSMEGQSHYAELFNPSSIREEADETLDALGRLDLGLSISRIASVDHMDVDALPAATHVLKSARVSSFLITTLFFGMVLSIIQNFLFLFLSRDLLMPASWIGWTGPTNGITELVCFCFSKQLTEMLGVTNMIVIAHVVTIIRCLFYTMLQADSVATNISALLIQSLHGIGFSIFWATAVSEIDSLFPPEQRAVAQGILGALYFGLGSGLGALVGGLMYQYLGAIPMFQITSIIAFISMGIFYVGRL